MYSLIPIVDTEVIYKTTLKIKKIDSVKIINNINTLVGESNIKILYEEKNDYIVFYISSNNQKNLEVFYFKISSIANDDYLRRKKKIEKKCL